MSAWLDSHRRPAGVVYPVRVPRAGEIVSSINCDVVIERERTGTFHFWSVTNAWPSIYVKGEHAVRLLAAQRWPRP